MLFFSLLIALFLGQCHCLDLDAHPNPDYDVALDLVMNRDDLIDPNEIGVAGADPTDLDHIKKKVLEPGIPKGIPFKPIKGPNSKQSKIGVVGAGPAGVHMAWSLKQLGYSDVTVIEKSSRIGGKSISYKVRGTYQILTTGWWNEEYYTNIVPLFARFGMLDDNSYASVDLASFVEWPKNDQSRPSNPLNLYAHRWLEEQFGLADPELRVSTLLQDVIKYINLHHKLFGKYEDILMRRPDKASMQLLSGSVKDFLQRHELTSLTPLFRIILSFFGFGTMETMPVIYGLIWATPSALFDLLDASQIHFFKNRTIDELFPLMIEEQNIPVSLDFDVIAIDQRCQQSSCSFKIKGSNGQEEDFDFLIWTGLPSDLTRILSKNSPSAKDLLPLFESMSHHYATVSVVQMSNVVRQGELQIFSAQLEADTFNNLPMRDYDTFAASRQLTNEDYTNKNFVYGDGSFDKYTFSVAQFCESKPDLEHSKKSLMDHYQGFGATDFEYFHSLTVPCDPRWNITDAAKGFHWDMYDLQGENNLWVLGGAFSFESLNAVVGYNQQLLKYME